MAIDDLPAVRAIEQESFMTPWPPHAYRSELENNRLAHYIVARSDGEVVGFAGMWLMVDEAHVTTFAVRRAWRRRGVGERLLLALLDMAAARGAKEATLEVRPSNLPARRLYEKYGFRQVGVRLRYYSDNNEDALILTTEPLDGRSMRQRLAELRAELTQRPDIEVGDDGRPLGWTEIPAHTDGSAGPRPGGPRPPRAGDPRAMRPGRVTRREW
jgi:ribosomal-protein-alanine N-acetyltransferase